MLPNSQRLNRGNYVMGQLVQACRANDVTDLIIIHEHRGEPSEITNYFIIIEILLCIMYVIYSVNFY